VPGTVTFSLDIRAPKDETVATMMDAITRDFPAIASGANILDSNLHCTPSLPLTVNITEDFASPATTFHQDCIQAVRQSAAHIVGANKAMEMTSGAGHDSVYASRRCPTSMIFVKCREGVSHNPREYCEEGDCAVGAQVLVESVIRFDQMRGVRRVTWKQEPFTL